MTWLQPLIARPNFEGIGLGLFLIPLFAFLLVFLVLNYDHFGMPWSDIPQPGGVGYWISITIIGTLLILAFLNPGWDPIWLYRLFPSR